MTADRELLHLARHTLTEPEFAVWYTHTYHHLGRYRGARTLAITQDAWRWRLATATRKLDQALTKEAA